MRKIADEETEVRSTGIMQFVVLQRVLRDDSTWVLPTVQQFHDLVGVVELELMKQSMEVLKVLKWSNIWDSVGVLGLDLEDEEAYQHFCVFIECMKCQNTVYAVVPKELVVEQSSVSTILRHEHRGLDLADLPDAIFLRNDLDGALEVTHSRLYGAADKTRAGQPKEGWLHEVPCKIH